MTFLIMYRTVTVLDAHETHAPTSRSVRCPVPNQHFIPLAAGVCESRDASLWRTALRVEAHELDVAAIGLYVGADLVLEDLLDGTHPPVVLALRRRLPRLLLLHAMTRHFGTVTERGGERPGYLAAPRHRLLAQHRRAGAEEAVDAGFNRVRQRAVSSRAVPAHAVEVH